MGLEKWDPGAHWLKGNVLQLLSPSFYWALLRIEFFVAPAPLKKKSYIDILIPKVFILGGMVFGR